MKAIILARVSTPEQKEAGNSLPSQLNRLEKYISEKNFEVVERFEIDESAYKDKREEFDKVMKIIRSIKDTVALCCDKIDRLTRNFSPSLAELESLRRIGRVELHFYSDNLVLTKDSSAPELFHFTIGVGAAKYYSDSIRDNIKRAWEQKVANGEIMTKAPIGFLNKRTDNDKQNVVRDDFRASMIIQIFEMYSTGLHSMQKIADEMKKQGLKSRHRGKYLKTRQIETILKNPFYFGFCFYKKQNITYAHKYTPLISKELFDKCKSVREAKTQNPTKATKHKFILSGMVLCADCGCRVTPELKKEKYKYYHCTNSKKICKKEFVREEKLVQPIKDLFRSFVLTDTEIEQILDGYDNHNMNHNKHTDQRLEAYKAEYRGISEKIEVMYDDKLEGRITADMYDKKVKDLNSRKAELETEIRKLQKGNNYCRITAKQLLSITKRMKNIFESSEVDEKRQILNLVFQNFSLQDKKLLFNTKTPFKEVFECGISSNNVSWSG